MIYALNITKINININNIYALFSILQFLHQMILQNLTTNSYYEVKVAAITFSVINPKKIVLGKFSEPRIVSIDMHKVCECVCVCGKP